MKLICSCFALSLPLGALGAQETPALAPGARVRVITPDGRGVVGSLEAIDSATIVVRRANGTTVAVPRKRGTQLDVSEGPGACDGRRGDCVGLGLLGGAAVGVLAGYLSVQSQGGASSPSCSGDVPCTVIYLVTVPAGMVLGAIVGAVVGGEDWERADLPARLSVGPDGSGRFAVGLSLRF